MRLFKTIGAVMAAMLVSAPVVAAINPAARLSLAEEDQAGGGGGSGKGTSTTTYLAIAGGLAAVVAGAVLLSNDNKPASA